jgi:hypothetical protein
MKAHALLVPKGTLVKTRIEQPITQRALWVS